MKKIGIVIPCYNEEENIVQITAAVENEIKTSLPDYNYEILIIDNCSTDNTRALVREICSGNKKVRAIFNAKNFGQFNSPYHALLQSSGDCVIPICADFQDPVEMIPRFVHEWENGYKIVCGIKSASKENPFVRFARTCYYKVIKKMSPVEQIEHFTGFALYDRSFIEVLRGLNDPTPFIRGIVAELGYKRKDIEYTQPKRAAGKTHNNFFTLYDAAMLSFTSYTKIGLRIASFAGFIVGTLSAVIGIIYLIMKLIWWDRFPGGTVPTVISITFLGSVQLFFLGFLGEYIMNINTRVMNRPLVIEEERINFESSMESVYDKTSLQ
ncbi:MAG: glycosyltransferase family 2 protein [Eubacterium sp.]|nr:glycosyltransferase family 2 protein [Eubacterium sp.]